MTKLRVFPQPANAQNPEIPRFLADKRPVVTLYVTCPSGQVREIRPSANLQ